MRPAIASSCKRGDLCKVGGAYGASCWGWLCSCCSDTTRPRRNQAAWCLTTHDSGLPEGETFWLSNCVNCSDNSSSNTCLHELEQATGLPNLHARGGCVLDGTRQRRGAHAVPASGATHSACDHRECLSDAPCAALDHALHGSDMCSSARAGCTARTAPSRAATGCLAPCPTQHCPHLSARVRRASAAAARRQRCTASRARAASGSSSSPHCSASSMQRSTAEEGWRENAQKEAKTLRLLRMQRLTAGVTSVWVHEARSLGS